MSNILARARQSWPLCLFVFLPPFCLVKHA
ncbi:hypothetical protein OIU77_008055 [Salix suchowensis]|uniref:Uncharacterized protein n=1 Tax=Salix suchowensis TaxID=1278906 RepID=A0ABQ9AKA8_9ROSI|nr:hypothetical protein OIU77_008055 [Salix suchowensis]